MVVSCHGEYLNKTNTDCLKGICAVGILLHHLYQGSGIWRETIQGSMLQSIGYLAVGIFFWVSGYGLMYSYMEKGEMYIKHFWRFRIMPTCVVYWLWIVVYASFKYITDISVGKGDILQSFLFGGTIVSNGWYMQTILVLYILFYIISRWFKNKYQVLVIILGGGGYIALCLILGLSTIWYESVPCFFLGMIWCKLYGKIEKYINKIVNSTVLYTMLLVIGTVIFGVFLIMGNINVFCSESIRIVFKMLSAICSTVIVIFMIMKIPINFMFTRWLGKYSLEIYLTQGLALSFFHTKFIYIENPWVYCLCVIVTVGIMAIIFHPICRWIVVNIKK